MSLILNALDQSAIASDGSAAQALEQTAALAAELEKQGYHRFWLAEHHNTSAFAIAAPEIMIAHILAATTRLRVGSGGVMLPHYSPLKIAEQFRMLEVLSNGRVDLGVGRAPGGDPKTAAALQPGPQAYPVEVFPQQLELLRQFLEDAAGLEGEAGGFPAEHPYAGIHAQPMSDGEAASENIVPLFMLGSGGDGAVHAAQFGLPYVYAHFINPDNLQSAIKIYRDNFRPSRQCAEPKVMVALSVLAATTDAEAQAAASPRNIWAARLHLNRAGRFPSMEEAAAYNPPDDEAKMLEIIRARSLTGGAEKVYAELQQLASTHAIDELFLLTLTPDFTARKTSYRLLAELNNN